MYESIPNELRTMEAGSKRMELYKRGLLHRAATAIEELSKRVEFEHQSGFADGQIAASRKKPRWIPVTERVPEEDCQVLVYYGFNRGDGYLGMMFMQVLDYYAHDPRPHFQHAGLNGMTVTHWMPLPEPPKEEQFGVSEQLPEPPKEEA